LAVSSRGLLAVATSSFEIRLYDTRDDVRDAGTLRYDNHAEPLAFSEDGNHLAACSLDGSVCIWDIPKRRFVCKSLTGLKRLTALAVCSDKQLLAVGSEYGSISILNWESGQIVRGPDAFPGHTSAVLSLRFSPENQLLASASWDGSLRLWSLREDSYGGALLDGQSASVIRLHFSSDGKTLFSAGGDNNIRIWDVVTRQLRFTLRGHDDGIRGLDLSPDGKTLVSGDFSGRVRFWRGEE
jgi:WD40 repeat protein